MIGAEIVALVAIIFASGFGLRLLTNFSKTRAAKRKHDEELDERMRKEMRAALEDKRHGAIDEFIVLWAFRLPKAERAQLEKIREDRYVSEDDP
jgi:hypothetical protein